MLSSSYLKLSLFFALTASFAGWLFLSEVDAPEPMEVSYCSFSFKEKAQLSPATLLTVDRPEVEELIQIREEMPLFPGCDDLESYLHQKPCADSLLLEFIYDNLSYPYTAWKDSVQGMAVVSFSVEKNGTISDARVVRDPGAGTGAEALRVVSLMNEQDIRWRPGTQAGKPVRVQFNLPVKFKIGPLNKITPPPPPPPPPHCKENSVMWSLPQAMPYPAVCAGLAQQDRFNCRNELLKTIIYDNLRWPNLDACVEGTAVVTFTVTDTGELQGFKIVRDPGAGTGKEALRVVKLMAEQTAPWIPGTQGLKKKPVPVQFNMPVKFKLE